MEPIDTVLFGKYQLCRILGTGRVGTVFLAVHMELEEYRAIKRVPKSFVDYERFRREALILKELRHPGIPIVYDVEEDETYSYLIEEYLQGESLHDLVRRQGHLKREETICYGLQLARIVEHLHIAGTTPILHLDLQPKNLLLCYGTIKLIDFDHAADAKDANVQRERYGTVGFAAPEQYEKDGQLDERTDLYAVGVILHYLYTGNYPDTPYEPEANVDRDLAGIIRTLLEPDRRNRFSSAQELIERLEAIRNQRKDGRHCPDVSPLLLAVAGSKSGAGTTHTAVGLSVYLRDLGYPNLYEERNDSGMGAALGAFLSAVRDRYGIMQYHGFSWKPAYGPAVRLPKPPHHILVADYGTNIGQAESDGADAVILVCDSALWSRTDINRAAKEVVKTRLPYVLVYNHVPPGHSFVLPEGIEAAYCFCQPYLPLDFLGNRGRWGSEKRAGRGKSKKQKGGSGEADFYRDVLWALSENGAPLAAAGIHPGQGFKAPCERGPLWRKCFAAFLKGSR